MLGFLLLVTVLSISAQTTDGLNVVPSFVEKNCDKKDRPNLHGSYQEKSGLIWSLTQVDDKLTFRATQQGTKRTGTGTLTLNKDCEWSSAVTFLPENKVVTIALEKGKKEGKKKLKLELSNGDVFTRIDNDPHIGGTWKTAGGEEWRCKQTMSEFHCWNKVGREGVGILERQNSANQWKANVDWVGESAGGSQVLYVVSDKELKVNNEPWTRIPCEKIWSCNPSMPSIGGTYTDRSGTKITIVQNSNKPTEITMKTSKWSRTGKLRQRPNRCYWGILPDTPLPGVDLPKNTYDEIAIRSNGLYPSIIDKETSDSIQTTDIWRKSGTSSIEEQAILITN